MQTYLVHMRDPSRLLAELGGKRFFGFQVLMGGLILSALVHPWFYLYLAVDAREGISFAMPQSFAARSLLALGLFNLAAGYLTAIALGAIAATRRGRPRLALYAVLMPVYWLAISAAAYRALVQLLTSPFYWEKTPHLVAAGGIARTSIVGVTERGLAMPATSKAQQRAAAIALAAKRGEVPVEELKGASLSMFRSMSEAQLEEFAATPRTGLPPKKTAKR